MEAERLGLQFCFAALLCLPANRHFCSWVPNVTSASFWYLRCWYVPYSEDGSLWGNESLQSSRGWSNKGRSQDTVGLHSELEAVAWIFYTSILAWNSRNPPRMSKRSIIRYKKAFEQLEFYSAGRTCTSFSDRRSGEGSSTTQRRIWPCAEGWSFFGPDASNWSTGGPLTDWVFVTDLWPALK